MRALVCVAVLAAAVAAASAASKVNWNGFHATWGLGGALSYGLGKAFYTLPTSAHEAQEEGWAKARDEPLGALWCLPDDPRVCLLYDRQGSVAGIQVAFPVDDLANTPYNWTQHSQFFEDDIFGQTVAAGRAYFVSPEVLAKGGRANVDEVGTGMWIKDGDSLVNVPQDANELEALGWTRESCIINMGRHYYYNISESMDCRDFEPFFLLVDNSHDWLKGFGFQTFGKTSVQRRHWQESVPGIAVKPTIPNAPACLTEWADTYGVLSVHVYFTSHPYLYFC